MTSPPCFLGFRCTLPLDPLLHLRVSNLIPRIPKRLIQAEPHFLPQPSSAQQSAKGNNFMFVCMSRILRDNNSFPSAELINSASQLFRRWFIISFRENMKFNDPYQSPASAQNFSEAATRRKTKIINMHFIAFALFHFIKSINFFCISQEPT